MPINKILKKDSGPLNFNMLFQIKKARIYTKSIDREIWVVRSASHQMRKNEKDFPIFPNRG
jgi:hypothetical protein